MGGGCVEPVWVFLCSGVNAVEPTASLWSTDEASPALSVTECGPNDLGECSGVDVGNFVDHTSIEIQAPEAIIVLGSIQSDPGIVVFKGYREFAFTCDNSGNAGGVFLEVLPCHVFGLALALPSLLVAVTSHEIFAPSSDASGTYVLEVSPGMATSSLSHW